MTQFDLNTYFTRKEINDVSKNLSLIADAMIPTEVKSIEDIFIFYACIHIIEHATPRQAEILLLTDLISLSRNRNLAIPISEELVEKILLASIEILADLAL